MHSRGGMGFDTQTGQRKGAGAVHFQRRRLAVQVNEEWQRAQLFLMRDGNAIDTCNFTDADELANVEQVRVGHVHKFDEAGMFHFLWRHRLHRHWRGFQGDGNQFIGSNRRRRSHDEGT
jgi:hypothetical protein